MILVAVVILLSAVLGIAVAAKLGTKLGLDMRLADVRPGMQARRRWRREHLTRGERVVYRVAAFSALLAPAGIVLLVDGSHGARTAGIVLVALGVLTTAVPVSPFLRARLRRRERSGGESVHK